MAVVGSAGEVVRQDVEIMFLRTRDVVDGIRAGWDRLEKLVGTRGRRFYGAIDLPTGEYRMCVETNKGDNPAALGLESGTLPGGRYLRARLKGEPPAIYDQIAPTFNALEKVVTPDPTRPEIEFYRQRDEIDLLVPLLD